MEANDLLMGGGVKSATFPDKQYGTTVGGLITRAPVTRQQTDYKTGEPKFFPNGDPMMQIVVQVQTDLRDPAEPLDDGVRGLYLKAQMMQAVRDAVKAVGGKGLEVGGHLAVTYVRDEPTPQGRGFDKKIYSATYRLPTGQANDVLMGTAATQPNDGAWVPSGLPGVAVPPRQQVPLVAAAPTPAPAPPPGVDPAMWARMAPEQQSAVLAAMGQTPPY